METMTVATNPNFSGPVRNEVLLVREVLFEEFANHGMVTDPLEEHLAANWERLNKVALMRTWEERAWKQLPDEAETCNRCGVERSVVDDLYDPGTRKIIAVLRKVQNWKARNAPHAEAEAYPYFQRAERYAAERQLAGEKSIDMDPDVARERIDLLLRSANPAEHAEKINELRTQVLGLEPIEFATDAIETPIVTQGLLATSDIQKAAAESPKGPILSPADEKITNFLTMDWREQKVVVEAETDLEFLVAVGKAPAKHCIPTVKAAAKKRREALGKPKE